MSGSSPMMRRECARHDRCHVTSWTRVSLVFLAAPLLILSCGTAPQGSLQTPDATPVQTSAPIHPQAYYYFLRGYLNELANDPDQAIIEYHKGLRVDPDSVYLRIRIARLYFSNSEMSKAVEMADSISTSNVTDHSELFDLAKIYAGTGHSEKALDLFDRVIEAAPDQEKGYLSKGMLLLGLKRTGEAQAVLQEAIANVPRSSSAYYYLGVAVHEDGKTADATQYFEKAIELQPDFRRAYQGLGTLYERQQQLEHASRVYGRYLEEVNPHDKEFRLQLVKLHLETQAYADALKQLELIIKDYPGDLNAQVRVALVYGEMGDYQQAIDRLTGILKARPNELRVRDYLGLMYEEMKDYDQAAEIYRENLRLNPDFYDSILHLGFLSYRQKQFSEAITRLEHAKAIHPKRSESYLLLGLTYLQQEQYVSAIKEFEEGIQQDPTNADLHFNLGTVYDKLNRFDDVVLEMERTLTLEPEHADALNYLGYSYADRGVKIEQAVELTRRAVKLRPNNGYYIDSLGWALFKVGRSEEALATIHRALSFVSDDPVIFEHLGEIHLQRQELEKAQKAWSRSIELDSSNERLIQRFRDHGFGEPTLLHTPEAELPKVSHSTSEHSVSP
ncbi:MAG: tetratricopeptide repeat protein [Nitrospirales bacterium]|nr:tetratricopeptide repeat protein [Nitrospira sp.]MDR4501367.1 tetratricopeptide repeat protein [Nitrospirales bacterium]